MKKSTRLMSILLAIVTVLSVLPMSALAAGASFTDVPANAWYYEPVTYMASNGYMSGTGDNKFSPNQTTTRAMFVTVLGRIAGIDQNQYKNTCTFRDVKKDWAEPYIAWASENNIVNGIGDNKFGPNNYVTREQAALILFNYLKKDYTLTVSDKFLNSAPDKSNVSSWAVEAMKWATSAALMRGDTDGSLRPRYSATRAEIATIFKRFIEIKTDLDTNKPDVPTTCDHVWETTKTEKVEVYHQTGEEWVYQEDMDIMNICNGCDMNRRQWFIDNKDNYESYADACDGLRRLAYATGCCVVHSATNNFHPINLTFPVKTTRTYVANLPVEETCTQCGATQPCVTTKTCNDMSDETIWIPHTKTIVVSEAWDEELINKGDGVITLDDEYGTEIPVPAGTHFDTIHHPEYSNEEVEYLENAQTGEKIYVEMISCRHNKWKMTNPNNRAYYCIDCNIEMPSVDELFD